MIASPPSSLLTSSRTRETTMSDDEKRTRAKAMFEEVNGFPAPEPPDFFQEPLAEIEATIDPSAAKRATVGMQRQTCSQQIH